MRYKAPGCALSAMTLFCVVSGGMLRATAQAPSAASAPAAVRQMGTVKSVSGEGLTLQTDAGAQMVVAVGGAAKLVQLAPGSTDLKAATPITLPDISVGDRVLVTGQAGEAAGSLSATRVILMKGAAIAERNTAEQADWQRRGLGGIVSSVDPAGVVTVSSGAKKIQVQTSGQTILKRYASDSIKFEDAKAGTLAQVQPGDQLEVRGAKSEDGGSIQAEEVVSGSFRNLSGTLASINASAGTLTLKDLTTKKNMTVMVTANSDLRKLSPEMAARFAARQRGGSSPAGAPPTGGPRAAGAPGAGGGGMTTNGGASVGEGGRPSGGGGSGGGMNRGSAGMDLSKMLMRLPTGTLADLKVGDAVMIVASQAQPGGDSVTAVTLLSGVEPILAATPTGAQAMTLSPWSVGGGAPGGGGGEP